MFNACGEKIEILALRYAFNYLQLFVEGEKGRYGNTGERSWRGICIATYSVGNRDQTKLEQNRA